MPRKPLILPEPRPRPPTYKKVLDTLDTFSLSVATMFGRWSDSVPPEMREELRAIEAEPMRVLIAAGRRRRV